MATEAKEASLDKVAAENQKKAEAAAKEAEAARLKAEVSRREAEAAAEKKSRQEREAQRKELGELAKSISGLTKDLLAGIERFEQLSHEYRMRTDIAFSSRQLRERVHRQKRCLALLGVK